MSKNGIIWKDKYEGVGKNEKGGLKLDNLFITNEHTTTSIDNVSLVDDVRNIGNPSLMTISAFKTINTQVNNNPIVKDNIKLLVDAFKLEKVSDGKFDVNHQGRTCTQMRIVQSYSE